MPTSYSHRNGETDKPTIEGSFGVRVTEPDGKRWGMIIEVAIEKGKVMWLNEPRYSYYVELPEGEYWGPLTGPWDEVDDAK